MGLHIELAMRIRKRYVPSALYNARNTGKFKLRKQIYYCGQNYIRIDEIAPRYYIGFDGEVLRYDLNTDTMKRVSVSDNLRVVLFPGEGRKPVNERLDFLVAFAWKKGRKGRTHVLHKNGNIMDCRSVNLMWAVSREQVRDNLRKRVIVERKRDGTRARYASVRQAVKDTEKYVSVEDLLEHLASHEPFPDGTVFRFESIDGGKGGGV